MSTDDIKKMSDSLIDNYMSMTKEELIKNIMERDILILQLKEGMIKIRDNIRSQTPLDSLLAGAKELAEHSKKLRLECQKMVEESKTGE